MATSLEIGWQRRRAIYRPKINRANYGISKGDEVKCRVWGCYKVDDGDGDVNPYFIVEIADGRLIYVSPEDLQFVDTDEEEGDEWLSCT